MYVAIVHRVQHAQAFSSHGEDLGDPSKARQEFGSVDSVRDYVDSTLGDSSANTYFEIDSEHALGLPEPATARA